MNKPRYSPGQRVRILCSWAENLPPQIIDNAAWDKPWNCYTYALIGGLFRIEEHDLAPVLENSQ